jgi:hypothetical protein
MDRTHTAENGRQQIAHGQVFDLPVAVGGPDHRTLQKAISKSVPMSISALVVFIIVLVIVIFVLVVFRHCLPNACQTSESCGRSYNASLYEVTPRLPDPREQLFEIRHIHLCHIVASQNRRKISFCGAVSTH